MLVCRCVYCTISGARRGNYKEALSAVFLEFQVPCSLPNVELIAALNPLPGCEVVAICEMVMSRWCSAYIDRGRDGAACRPPPVVLMIYLKNKSSYRRCRSVHQIVLRDGTTGGLVRRGPVPPPPLKLHPLPPQPTPCVSRTILRGQKDNDRQKNDTSGTRTHSLCHRKATPYH